MLQEIDITIVEASRTHRLFYGMAVQECIKLRKKINHSIIHVAEELAVTRQKLSKFEKLQIYDTALLSNYLELYFKQLQFSIVQLQIN